MKKIFFVVFFIYSFVSFSQTSYFVDQKGNKTIMRDDAFDVLLIDKRITYVLPGKSWEKYVKFEDLNYAVVGPSLLKSFKLDKKKKSDVYFVYGEKKDKKLIGIAISISVSHGDLTTSYTTYELYVIDNDDMILDKVITQSGNSKWKIDERKKIAPMIKNHFSDCSAIMLNILNSEKEDEKSKSVLDFFNDTSYINCKQ